MRRKDLHNSFNSSAYTTTLPLTACYKTKAVYYIDSPRTGSLARTLRKSLSLSLKTMAARMGISFAHLSKLERGERNWSSDLIDRFNLNYFKPIKDNKVLHQ